MDDLPKNVALGELYAKYSLFDAHAGNSFCLIAPPSLSSSSPRFHGRTDSVAVGVATVESPVWNFFVIKNKKTKSLRLSEL